MFTLIWKQFEAFNETVFKKAKLEFKVTVYCILLPWKITQFVIPQYKSKQELLAVGQQFSDDLVPAVGLHSFRYRTEEVWTKSVTLRANLLKAN